MKNQKKTMESEANLLINICCRRSSVPASNLLQDIRKLLIKYGHKNIRFNFIQGWSCSGDNNINTGCDGMTCDEVAQVNFIPEGK